MPAPTIFISYRREDCAGHAGRLGDRLEAEFGADKVFRDVEDIAAGADFTSTLYEQVDRCGVLLALIGPRWLGAAGPDGRQRLFDPNDWVRAEIARALERRIRVIPVLVGGAAMPAAKDLPADLAALATRNAVEIRDAQFERDAAHLAELLGSGATLRRYRLAIAALLVTLLGMGALAGYLYWAGSADRALVKLQQIGLPFTTEAFLTAASSGHDRAVELFLQAGMDPDASDDRMYSALTYALIQRRPAMALMLIEHGADHTGALTTAIAHEQDTVVDRLLDDVPAPEEIQSAFDTAADRGSVPLLERLLALGADPDAGRGAALFAAVGNGQVEALRWLLGQGARVTVAVRDEGWSVLHAAAHYRGEGESGDNAARMVRQLLQAGADVNAQTTSPVQPFRTPLLAAIDAGNDEAARRLVEAGADGSIRSNDRRRSTALLAASAKDRAQLVDLLLQRGTSADERDHEGNPPLLVACEHRAHAVMQVLIRHGVDLQAQGGEHRAALSVAVRNLDSAAVGLLLDAGAAVDAPDATGLTPLLQLASPAVIRVGYPAQEAQVIARRLLAAGASRTATNAEGKTALELAQERGYAELVEVLGAAADPG